MIFPPRSDGFGIRFVPDDPAVGTSNQDQAEYAMRLESIMGS